MNVEMESKMKLPLWWFILPAYLTLWSVSFSFWSLADGKGMMEAFGIDTGEASTFVMLNAAARYVAIGIGMVVGIWIFKTFHSILTALIVRLVMDVLDLYSGLEAGVIESASGIVQSFLMFLAPNLISIIVLIRIAKK